MKLTSLQEEQLIQQYDRYIWSMVHRFGRRKTRGNEFQNDKNDLYQECVMVFLKHIRSCETMEEINKVPSFDMLHAMCQFSLRNNVVTYPKRTSNFRHIMDNVARKVDYDEVDLDENQRSEPLNDALDVISFKDFYAALSSGEQKIVTLKLRGYSNREIAQKLGLTDVAVCRALKRMRNAYQSQVQAA